MAGGQLARGILGSRVDGPDGVDHPPRGQLTATRRHGPAGREPVRERGPADLPALGQDRGSAGPVDRAVDAAAAQQGRVRRVHDRVDLLGRDVALDEHDLGHGHIVGCRTRMEDIAAAVRAVLLPHPDVRAVELVGSRAGGSPTPLSDWDFVVVTERFDEVARALPALVAELEPLGQQWDRISAYPCYMLLLAGPVKVDLIFPDEPLRVAPAVDRERRDPRRDRSALLGLDPVARVQAGEARGRARAARAGQAARPPARTPRHGSRPRLDRGRGRARTVRPGTSASASSASRSPGAGSARCSRSCRRAERRAPAELDWGEPSGVEWPRLPGTRRAHGRDRVGPRIEGVRGRHHGRLRSLDRHPRRGVHRPGGPVRLRQDDRAQDGRRPGEHHARDDRDRRPGGERPFRPRSGTSRWSSRTTRCTRT